MLFLPSTEILCVKKEAINFFFCPSCRIVVSYSSSKMRFHLFFFFSSLENLWILGKEKMLIKKHTLLYSHVVTFFFFLLFSLLLLKF